MQTAHYSISEIIIADATDNDAMGKNKISQVQQTRIYEHLFNIQWQMAIRRIISLFIEFARKSCKLQITSWNNAIFEQFRYVVNVII